MVVSSLSFVPSNAASLTALAIAVKLPMDLTNLMPGHVDRAAKIGSLAFMCTVMANLLPSLATMSNKEFLTNMMALGVLVITLVIDVCIQINTGILSYQAIDDASEFFHYIPRDKCAIRERTIATSYVIFLLMLLMIYACSSLAILKSKEILESKYQAARQAASNDQELQQPGNLNLLTAEKLKQHVRNMWIMTGTGSPQFMTIYSITAFASWHICVVSNFFIYFYIRPVWDYNSDYKWSTLVILIIQIMGVILGQISVWFRSLGNLTFWKSWAFNHFKVFKVENYWTQKLSDWKQNNISFLSRSRKCKIVIKNLKVLFLNICIGFQMAVVIVCKMIWVFVNYFDLIKHFSVWLNAQLEALGMLSQTEQLGRNTDHSQYVLQLQDDMRFTEFALTKMLTSVNHLIQKAEKQQPNNLMKLLAESGGFEGVEKFDIHRISSLLPEEYLNCWRLPLVTLTTIAMSLPNIQKSIANCSLISGVSEGLVYVTVVEETLNATDDHVHIQKAANALWWEVDIYHKWLGYKLQKHHPQVNTAGQILQWLRDTSKNMVMEVEGTAIRVPKDDLKRRSISANSMYRITETILLSYHTNIDELSQEELFVQLSLMIADILSACLTNLPQVILMNCHTNAIEKREVSVQAAAQLLGETTQSINTLQQRELPSLNPDELPFIDKWRALMDPFP